MASKYLFKVLTLLLVLVGLPSLHAQPQATSVKAIVFDFSGVIAKKDKGQIVQFVATSLSISPDHAQEALQNLKHCLKKGSNEEDFWQVYAQSIGRKLPANWLQQLDQARLKAIVEIPGMVNLVKNLQKNGFQTALLSNGGTSRARLKDQIDLYNLFHPVLLSSDIGIAKPNPKVFQILLDTLQLSANQVLLIDNKAENIQAAKKLGIDGIEFKNPDQLIQELDKRGIRVSTAP
ncbi:HAD family hydrolase [Candidatus Protochlamydia phocaeensis]|uniref:HAD family hydrolase n=1 Tax=Candidatus Protochlamydia phocaeensis TaxID=1414722 RepID=UPI000839734E|nr:HAD family phosphatase [Candidatus Protochlamydia phocaeensis]